MIRALPTPTVRRAISADDFAAAAAILHDYAEWLRTASGLEPFDEQPSFGPELDDLAANYAGHDGALFIAESRGLTLATIAVRYEPDGAAELKRLYVRPIARRAGLADRLIAHVVDHAARRGCHELWLETLRGAMDPAIAVYRRHGFDIVGEVGRTARVDGIVVMTRQLREEPADARRAGTRSSMTPC